MEETIVPVAITPGESGRCVLVDLRGNVIAVPTSRRLGERLAALINGTADTPADPDAGLSDMAQKAIAKIRHLDASNVRWSVNVRADAIDNTRYELGGREGGAA